MTPFERWSGYVSNLLVGGTGVVYGVMVYLLRPSDLYAVVNHPLQPLVQHLHVLTAPLLVFAVGLVWQRHVAPRLGKRGYPRRSTGLGLALLFVPMVVSGYLLQVAGGSETRRAWGLVHLVASCLWLAAFVVHLLSPATAARRAALLARVRARLSGSSVGARDSRARGGKGKRGDRERAGRRTGPGPSRGQATGGGSRWT